jgi:hypothetical protein
MEASVAEVGCMTYAVVTTFSQQGYEVYGRHFIETFTEFWPADVPLYVFYEGEKPADASERPVWIPLDMDKDREVFMSRHKDEDPSDYRKCPVRFCHKVYAMTGAPRHTDHLIFLDSDCETFAAITDDVLRKMCGDAGQIGSFLARPYARHSETGFLSFRKNNCGYEFLAEFRRFYNSGELFNLSELHDSMAFDYLRRKFERAGHRFKNICPGARGLSVFEQSHLKDHIKHFKGAGRKERKYGHHMIPGERRPLNQVPQAVIDEIA